MALFYRPRRPFRPKHTPISYDARKYALRPRRERIREQLIEDGELPGQNKQKLNPKEVAEAEERFAEELRDTMRNSMTHLPKQEEKGKSGTGRWSEFLRILLMLLLLGLIIWLLYYRR